MPRLLISTRTSRAIAYSGSCDPTDVLHLTLPLIPQRTVGKLPQARITLDPAQKALIAYVVVAQYVTYQLLETTHAFHVQIGQLARIEPGPHGQHTAVFLTLVRLRRIHIHEHRNQRTPSERKHETHHGAVINRRVLSPIRNRPTKIQYELNSDSRCI